MANGSDTYPTMERVNIDPEIPIESQFLPDLTGKRVLINGGTRGIGLETAKLAQQCGGNVIVVARHFENIGFPVAVYDMSNPQEIEAMFQKAGHIDYVFNNVGLYHQGNILDTSYQDWLEVVQVNLNSAFMAIKQSLRYLSPKGVMVNMSTRPTLERYAGWSAYTIAKTGVITLTQAAAEERPDIGCYAICPSRVDTKFRNDLFPDEPKETRLSPYEVALTNMYLFNGSLPNGTHYWIKKRV